MGKTPADLHPHHMTSMVLQHIRTPYYMVQVLDSRTLDMIVGEDDAVVDIAHNNDSPAFQAFVMSVPLDNMRMVVFHQEEVPRIPHAYHIRTVHHVMLVRDDLGNLRHVPVVVVLGEKQDTSMYLQYLDLRMASFVCCTTLENTSRLLPQLLKSIELELRTFKHVLQTTVATAQIVYFGLVSIVRRTYPITANTLLHQHSHSTCSYGINGVHLMCINRPARFFKVSTDQSV